MESTRRTFLRTAGVAGVAAMTGLGEHAQAADPKPKAGGAPGAMARDLTLCTLQREGGFGTVPLPTKVATKFDYEAELVVVVGRRMRDVPTAEALDHAWGFCTGNDFTARDLQQKTTQWMLGKTPDGFAPLGPWLVGADAVGDPQNLKIECRVNGEVRQSSNTSDMIYSCADLLAYASQHMTLEPGDILFTGTPEGVINGKPPDKQVWLKPGDRIETEIEKCGKLVFDLGTRTA